MAEPPKPVQKLAGWKEIADYLGVSVRTAQNFEVERGLPVHRRSGIKTPVYAVSAELAVWEKNQTDRQATKPTEVDTAPGEPPSENDRTVEGSGGNPSRRTGAAPKHHPAEVSLRPRLLLFGLLAAITIGIVGLYWFVHRRGQPSSFSIEGRLLTVFDEHNRRLWEHVLPPDIQPSDPGAEWPHKFVDLEEAGQIGLILSVGAQLYCFDPYGKVLWIHPPGREVLSVQGNVAPANYSVKLVDVLTRPRRDGGRIIVGSHQGPTSLFVVEVLTKGGKKVGEYFHFGWFFAIKAGVLDQNGHEDIFLSGVDDASRTSSDYGATLVVLDPDRVWGQATTVTRDPNRTLRDIPLAREKALLLIREFAPSLPNLYCRGRRIVISGGSLQLFVIKGDPPGAYFFFDRQLRLKNVLPDVLLQQILQSTIGKNVPPTQQQDVMRQFLGDIVYVRNEFDRGTLRQ